MTSSHNNHIKFSPFGRRTGVRNHQKELRVRTLLMACCALAMLATTVWADSNEKGDTAAQQEMIQKIHTHFSTDCFNKCWTVMDKAERSAEDVEDMLLLAHASLWHWKQRTDRKPENLSIGYWLVSRVYAVAGNYELARLFGLKCLDISEDASLSPFLVGYAHEALARAGVLNKDFAAARTHLSEAEKLLPGVTDDGEKGFLAADITELKNKISNQAMDRDKQ